MRSHPPAGSGTVLPPPVLIRSAIVGRIPTLFLILPWAMFSLLSTLVGWFFQIYFGWFANAQRISVWAMFYGGFVLLFDWLISSDFPCTLLRLFGICSLLEMVLLLFLFIFLFSFSFFDDCNG
ncbi:hypothetical protein LINPERHAP2_LOCUS35040, partial [Linum perenne]